MMKINFCWVSADDSFDPTIQDRCDLEILTLTIDHREGEVAVATLVVAVQALTILSRRHVFISQGPTLIFAGRLVGLPAKVNNDLMSLELTSEPLSAEEQVGALSAELYGLPYGDPLFMDPIDQQNPVNCLEARSALFAWNRLNGTVCLSDLFQGRQSLSLGGVFFADSLKIKLAEPPLTQINISVTAEWIQEGQGEINVGPKIAAAFSGGMVTTLTPQALEVNWPCTGQKIGQSTGYWIAQSSLKTVEPPNTGILGIYPTVTPEFLTETDDGILRRRLQRFWMVGSVTVGWHYRQKRREVIHFTLAQKTQLDGAIRPTKRSLNLRLQSVGASSTASSFFLTYRGRQALEHALEMARAHLAASSRCLEIEVEIPFEIGFELSLDHTVHLADPRIPGGQARGKVIAYRLCQNGVKSYAWVRIAVAPGLAEDQPFHGKPTYYVDPSYGDTAIACFHQTLSGLSYGDYSHQKPKEGFENLAGLSLRDLLREVVVSHDAEKQIQMLRENQYPLTQNVLGLLREIPTSISLDLVSLKTHGVLEHHIYVDGVGNWSPPRQVMLQGDSP